MWQHLNRRDVAPSDSDQPAPLRHRLGDYAAQAIAPLNMRPTSMTLLHEDEQRIEIRVSTAIKHVTLVLSDVHDLANEVLALRTLAAQRLPAPQLVHYELLRERVPYSYLVLGHISGQPLRTADPAVLRMIGRQVGRTLRRLHQMPAGGFGNINAVGRWSAPDWREALKDWLAQGTLTTLAAVALGEEHANQLWEATLLHPMLEYSEPRVLHGAIDPTRLLVTLGESVQLDSLGPAGVLVGGDPMFDLAWGLRPCLPVAFRQGLLEGYTATMALTPEQEQRLRRLQLLAYVADSLLQGDELVQKELSAQVKDGLAQM